MGRGFRSESERWLYRAGGLTGSGGEIRRNQGTCLSLIGVEDIPNGRAEACYASIREETAWQLLKQ
jgi:hypothetical protein